MLSIPMASSDTTPGFTVDPSDPNYWSLLADYEYVFFRRAMRAAGVEYTVQESSDLSTVSGGFTTTLSQLTTWWESYLVDKGTEFVVNLVDLAPLITAIASGGSADVLPLLLGHVFNLIVASQEKGTKSENDGANVISEAVGDASGMPDTLHISILNDPDDNQDERWQVSGS